MYSPCWIFSFSSAHLFFCALSLFNAQHEISEEIDSVYGNTLLPAILHLQGIIC